MNNTATDLEVKIAAVAALEALQLMARKACVSPATVLDAILECPDSAAVRYFETLVADAIREVPAMLVRP